MMMSTALWIVLSVFLCGDALNITPLTRILMSQLGYSQEDALRLESFLRSIQPRDLLSLTSPDPVTPSTVAPGTKRGRPGAKGVKGFKGVKGPEGLTGLMGLPGDNGDKGDTGGAGLPAEIALQQVEDTEDTQQKSFILIESDFNQLTRVLDTAAPVAYIVLVSGLLVIVGVVIYLRDKLGGNTRE